MKEKFYIEIEKNFIPDLKKLNAAFLKMDTESKDAVLDFMNAIGFYYDITNKAFIRIDYGAESTWDIREHSDYLIIQKDLKEYVKYNTDLSLAYYTEAELDDAVEFIVSLPTFDDNNVHQSTETLRTGADYLRDLHKR